MKILYESIITKETGFTATDFPDRFEILRKGKTPLVFKPVAIDLQTAYARLEEAEILLSKIKKRFVKLWGTFYSTDSNRLIGKHLRHIEEYFDRHVQ